MSDSPISNITTPPSAAEGFKVPAQKTLPGVWFRAHPQSCLLVLCLLLSCLVEAFAFNYPYFSFDTKTFPQANLSLGEQSYSGHTGMMLTSEQNTLSVNIPDLKVRTVKAQFWSPSAGLVRGNISYKDSSNTLIPIAAAQFIVCPSCKDPELSGSFNEITPQGTVKSLLISLDRTDCAGGVVVTALTLNEQPSFNFSYLRTLLLFAVFSLIALIRLHRWYRIETRGPDRAEIVGSRCMLMVALALCCGYFALISPATTRTMSLNFQGEADITVTSEDHRLFLPLPQTEDELKHFDHFANQLHAFLKGQINLDFTADPKLLALDNVNDFGARAAAGVKYYFEYALFNGKYYMYYGLMPVFLLYLPVYLLSGCVPAPATACFILSVPALCAVYLALRSLRRTFPVQANLLMVLLITLVTLCSTGIFILLTACRFYSLPCLCGIIFVGIFIASVWALPRQNSPGRLLAVLALCSLCVPCIVISRPNMLLMALCVGIPVILHTLWGLFKNITGSRLPAQLLFCKALCCLTVPALTGAVLVCWYNHVRFGSVFDFGYNYTLTGRDVSSTQPLSPAYLRNMLYLYFFEPLSYSKNFPYVLPAAVDYQDLGGSNFVSHRISLFSLPLLWGMFLLFIRPPHTVGPNSSPNALLPWSCTRARAMRLLRTGGLLLWLFIPVAAAISYARAGFQARFFSDYAISCALVVFVPWLHCLRYDHTPARRVLYLLSVFFLVKSLLIGVLFPLSYDQYRMVMLLNPEFWLTLNHFLSPIGY